ACRSWWRAGRQLQQGLRCDLRTRVVAVDANGMAGAEGLEPSNAGIKIPCLTSLATPQFLVDGRASCRDFHVAVPGPARTCSTRRVAAAGGGTSCTAFRAVDPLSRSSTPSRLPARPFPTP